MRLVVIGAALLATAVAAVEGQQPASRRASPEAASATEIRGRWQSPEQRGYVGGKWLEIRYGRPIKRSRDLFGPDDFVDFLNDGAPVWRAGANRSTQLVNEIPLEIGGTRVPPGEYTIFIEVSRDAWILIVSSYPAQKQGFDANNKNALFGAFDYTPAKDVVRVPMKLDTMPFSFDQLHWQFLDVSDAGGRLAIFWDTKMASVPFKVLQ